MAGTLSQHHINILWRELSTSVHKFAKSYSKQSNRNHAVQRRTKLRNYVGLAVQLTSLFGGLIVHYGHFLVQQQVQVVN